MIDCPFSCVQAKQQFKWEAGLWVAWPPCVDVCAEGPHDKTEHVSRFVSLTWPLGELREMARLVPPWLPLRDQEFFQEPSVATRLAMHAQWKREFRSKIPLRGLASTHMVMGECRSCIFFSPENQRLVPLRCLYKQESALHWVTKTNTHVGIKWFSEGLCDVD